jgi:hypothetical protein
MLMKGSERRETVRYLRDLAELVAGGEMDLAEISLDLPRTHFSNECEASHEAAVHWDQTVTIKLVRRSSLMDSSSLAELQG